MAADDVAVAIKKRHFDGHQEVTAEHRRVGDNGSKHLAQILRNFVAELTDRYQSSSDTLAAGTKAVTLPVAMPDASYDVACTFTVDPGAAKAFFVTLKTTTGFTVTTNPGAGAETFDWIARHRTRLNTKG